MVRGGVRLGPGTRNLFKNTASSRIPGSTVNAASFITKNGRIVGANSNMSLNNLRKFAVLKNSGKVGSVVARGALNIGSNLAAIGGAGLLNGLFTGIEEFGGNNNHRLGRKVARTAGSAVGGIIGGALGSFAGPIGIMIGSYAGSQLGKIISGNDYRRNKKRTEWGLEHLNGDYSVRDLRRIKEGKISGKLQKTMEKNGDYTEISAYERQQLKASGDLNDMVKDMHDAMLGEGMAKVNGRANGGSIYGPGGVDNVPIWASRGEFIMSNKAVNM